MLLVTLTPGVASADVGSTIFQRFWDSLVWVTTERTSEQGPDTATLLDQAEYIFLGTTDDLTALPAVAEVVGALQYVGLFVLAYCFILSLADVTTNAMLGGNYTVANWLWRFLVASGMTLGVRPVYGFCIRLFNYLTELFRTYLDTHWAAPTTGEMYTTVLEHMFSFGRPLLLLLVSGIFLLICLVLWFLVGGVRPAELVVHILLAPLTWPLYLIPGLEDIPKTAFRSFLGINALLLMVVAMLRLAGRWATAGSLGDMWWNFVPAVSLMGMAVFLPGIVKRLVGQSHSGMGALGLAVNLIGGLKLLAASAAMGRAAGAMATASAAPAAAAAPAPAPAASSAASAPSANLPAVRGAPAAPAPTVRPAAPATPAGAPVPFRIPAEVMAQAAPAMMGGVDPRHMILDLVEDPPGHFSVARDTDGSIKYSVDESAGLPPVTPAPPAAPPVIDITPPRRPRGRKPRGDDPGKGR